MGLKGQEYISRLQQGDKDGYTDIFDGDCKKIDNVREYCSRARNHELEREFARKGIEYKKVIESIKVERTGWSTRAVIEFCGVAFVITTPLIWALRQKFKPECWAPAVLGILVTGGSWLGRYVVCKVCEKRRSNDKQNNY